jgi:membrane protein
MKWKNRIERLKKFITKDLWFLDIEEGVSGVRKFLLKELQMLILIVKFTDKNFLFSRASALAFTTLLSLIPVLAIMFMFFKAFGGGLVDEKIKPMIYDYLTAGIGDSITGYIDSFLGSATVDTLGSIGFIFLLWAVYSILSSIEVSFNAIWQVSKNRSPVEMLKTYLTIVFIAPILMILSLWLASRIEGMVSVEGNHVMGFISFAFFQFSPFLLVTVMFMFLLVIMPNTQVKIIQCADRFGLRGSLFYRSQSTFYTLYETCRQLQRDLRFDRHSSVLYALDLFFVDDSSFERRDGLCEAEYPQP